jgi:regulator of protease activity HflC (stomatin/prohibitin superfamily)
VGVVKRLGQFRDIRQPGVAILMPFVDGLTRVETREVPATGDKQAVITRDNVSVLVNATIFSQIVDAKLALFSVSNYKVGIDQLAKTALRAIFGEMTLDEALSQREQINAKVQQQMEAVTDKWGIRINRIEIIDIEPPAEILQALSQQKIADQQKRAAILKSEGEQQSAINTAQGQKQAAILQAEGEKAAIIARAEGSKQAAILEAEGRAQSIQKVFEAIKSGQPDDKVLAMQQLDMLAKLAASPNSKLIVPVETACLLGAAESLKSVFLELSKNGSSNGSGVLKP